jgi:hypothetical protein
MSWQTWGYGAVHVPHAYTFPFQASADSIRVQVHTEHDAYTLRTRYRFVVLADFPGYDTRQTEIAEFSVTESGSVRDERPYPAKDHLQNLAETVARSAASYTAAHMLSNIAAIISRFSMSQEAKDQIISALVMTLPNFDDSEQLKSPVGKGLVRTRAEFIHAARTARFSTDRQATEDAIREYMKGTSVYDTTEIKRWLK